MALAQAEEMVEVEVQATAATTTVPLRSTAHKAQSTVISHGELHHHPSPSSIPVSELGLE